MATNYAVAPGEFLREWIDEEGHGITQTELAKHLDVSRKLVNEIINGRAPITPDTAIRLGRVTSIPCDAWLRYEAQYQSDQARLRDDQQLQQHEEIVTPQLAAYLRKLGVSSATMRNKAQVLNDFLTFLGFGTYEAYVKSCEIKLGPSFATLRESGQSYDTALMMAWLSAGEHTPAYQKTIDIEYQRNALVGIVPTLTHRVTELDDSTLTDCIQLLETAGVVCQFVKPPSPFPLYGAVAWTHSGVPVIQLTGRRKENCHVIWSLFHELGHILYDGAKTMQLEFSSTSAQKQRNEIKANEFARTCLIPGGVQSYFGMTYAWEIEAEAQRRGHIPCVVVQELHRMRKLDRSWGNELVFDMTIPFQA